MDKMQGPTTGKDQGLISKEFVLHKEKRPDGKIVVDSLTVEEIEEWWPIYNEPFVELNKSNPCRQSFNREEFEEAMTSPTMAKLAYVDDGEIVAMCLLSNDFSHFPWMSEDFYKEKYPNQFENNQVYYFVSLLARQDRKGQFFGSKVVEFITELYKLADNEAVITFDCCQDNAQFLPLLIENVVDGTGMGELKFESIGTQHYFAGQLELK